MFISTVKFYSWGLQALTLFLSEPPLVIRRVAVCTTLRRLQSSARRVGGTVVASQHREGSRITDWGLSACTLHVLPHRHRRT